MNGLPNARLRRRARPASRSRSRIRRRRARRFSTPASTGSTPRRATTKSRVFKSTNAAASWSMLPRRHRRRHRRGLLRRAVLLRQRDRGRPDEPERRVRRRPVRLRHHARGRDLPLRRRRCDVAEPRLRPAPGLPRARVQSGEHRSRSSSATTAACGTSTNQGGGRPSDPLSAVDWQNLNGTSIRTRGVTAARVCRSRSSRRSRPCRRSRGPGGSASGAARRTTARCASRRDSKTWFDVGGGDGGQVLVDPTADSCGLGPSCFVYGTFYSPPISPYRWTDGGELLHATRTSARAST